jgi:LmbE family N-acetylglucosaminyl deacetylase
VTTIVAFHAHPDDEALLTGGTLALLAAAGHRVVIVVACDGIMGEATTGGHVRLDELEASASVLGAARVVHLGYADSGHGPELFPDPADRIRFARADLEEAAGRLARILREEQAEILFSYDRSGGYGHRDHVKVHHVGARAAVMVGTVRVLEATVPRQLVVRLFTVTRFLRLTVRYDASSIAEAYCPRAEITHRIDVRRGARQKRAALAAHRSQMTGGRSSLGFRVLTRLPLPVFGLLLGHEWFREPGVTRSGRPRRDILTATDPGAPSS